MNKKKNMKKKASNRKRLQILYHTKTGYINEQVSS